MSLDERSYPGKTMRPSPEIRIEEDGSFGAIITPWGPRLSVKRVMDTLSDFILSAKNDMEQTSPFQMLTCLSAHANTLRAATMLANDVIYREENKTEYLSGVEVFAFSRSETEFSFVNVGQPHVLLARKSMPLMILSSPIDLALEVGTAIRRPAPLPHNLLGLHSTSNFQVISFRPMVGDELIFVSRTRIPPALMLAPEKSRNLEGFSQILANDNVDEPFWLARYTLPMWSKNREEEAA